MLQPTLPSGWNELSFQQLRDIHHIICNHADDHVERNMQIFLYLSELELSNGDVELQPGDDPIYLLHRKSDTARSEMFSVRADDLYLFLNGNHISLRGKSQRIFDGLNMVGALDWVDNSTGTDSYDGLTRIPQDFITISGRVFMFPTELITNITYEQYCNAQKIMQAVWSLMEDMLSLQQTANDNTEKLSAAIQAHESGKTTSTKKIELYRNIVQGNLSELDSIRVRIDQLRARLLCHLLNPKKWKWARQDWMQNIRHHGIFVWNYDWNYSYDYDSTEAENLLPWMQQQSEPKWLFDIVTQHLQSCIHFYKGQFRDLFGDSASSGSDVTPLVGEVDTINSVMKWQGFSNQQQVYDANAISIFGVLNQMTHEAKAIEEANSKMSH